MFDKLKNELKEAMKIGNKERRDAIRYAISTIQSIAKKENREVIEKDVIQGINKLIKQTKESIESLKKDNRDVTKEEKDIKTWEEFIPKKMNRDELTALIKNILMNQVTPNRGLVMKELSKRNNVDMKMANEILNELLKK